MNAFCCPEHAALLEPSSDAALLVCSHGCSFPVVNGVARFVPDDQYASSFGLQWNMFRKTQLDSFSGTTISRDRLSRIMGGLDWLSGKKVLEAGCGSGRFSEVLLQTGAAVHSLDLSPAVDAAKENCSCFPEHRVSQASILRMPFASGSFDAVVCIGVVQHTPNPEETLAALARMVRPGGLLFINHYAPGYPMPFVHRLLRAFLLRLPLKSRLPFCTVLRSALWPLHTRLHARRQKRGFGRLYRWLTAVSPLVDYLDAYPQLSPESLRAWALLDMHDLLTDVYKHLRTTTEIRGTLEGLGLVVERCEYAGNGVEASARKPLMEGGA